MPSPDASTSTHEAASPDAIRCTSIDRASRYLLTWTQAIEGGALPYLDFQPTSGTVFWEDGDKEPKSIQIPLGGNSTSYRQLFKSFRHV